MAYSDAVVSLSGNFHVGLASQEGTLKVPSFCNAGLETMNLKKLAFALAYAYFVLPSATEAKMATEYHKYCVVGAGPAGVQLGHLLNNPTVGNPRDYVILEKHHSAAAFFQKYPIHRQLNSINRRSSPYPLSFLFDCRICRHTRSTDREFNLR